MRDIADQFLILFIKLDLLFRTLLQTYSHIFKVLIYLTKFIIISFWHLKIQIAILNILRSLLDLRHRSHDCSVYPHDQCCDCKKQDQYHNDYNFSRHRTYFRHHSSHIRNKKCSALFTIFILKINLLYKRLRFTAKINTVLRWSSVLIIFRQLADHRFCFIIVCTHICHHVIPAHQQIRLLLFQFLINLLQKCRIFHLLWCPVDLITQFSVRLHRRLSKCLD